MDRRHFLLSQLGLAVSTTFLSRQSFAQGMSGQMDMSGMHHNDMGSMSMHHDMPAASELGLPTGQP